MRGRRRDGSRDQASADAGPAVLLHRCQCRRHRLHLFRQDGHGSGPVGRHPANGGGRARRGVQRHQDFHRRHRDQHQPRRRIRIDRRAGGRQADAHGRRRGAPGARRDGRRKARRCGRSVDRDRQCRARRERYRKEDQLRSIDRRPVLQRPSRLEWKIRQSALRAGQSHAKGSEGSHHRRAADSARRHRAESLYCKPTLPWTSKSPAWCMAA